MNIEIMSLNGIKLIKFILKWSVLVFYVSIIVALVRTF